MAEQDLLVWTPNDIHVLWKSELKKQSIKYHTKTNDKFKNKTRLESARF